MPKTFSETDKKKWLELHESGKTEKWIAREHAKCDLRTVRRGIEEARRKQDARVARAELLKEALRKHQDSLLTELDEILSVFVLPSEAMAVLSWYNDGVNSIFNHDETPLERQLSESSKPYSLSGRQGDAVRKLLKQHLKNDRLWKLLAQWEKAYAAHMMARIALQRKTVALLQEKTGCKLTDRTNVPPPVLCSYTAGVLFYDTVLKQALDIHTGMDVERDMVIDPAGNVKCYSSTLAEVPGMEKQIQANLLEALQELKTSPEVGLVGNTYDTLKEIAAKARDVIEQIKLLGLITGQCEICRRLGL